MNGQGFNGNGYQQPNNFGMQNFNTNGQGFNRAPLPAFFGREINDPNEVTVQEIPMNGTPAFFPLSDYSAIYLKFWSSNGTIATVKMVPEVEISEPKVTTEDMINALEERINKLEKAINKPKSTTKKEEV